ncbi:NUMOD4 domain-containing protein [Lactiplantibacillus plantarum]|uniref:NUMOD4 domain-containing protein n=1 Tax=Lactiplantibacillus plantarum TaxID=1590 RepID=UPI00067CB765|nr:NUMOD4 domain-containing protein [Lactiplantibacillus plantarum]
MNNKLVEAEIFRTSPYEGYSVSTLGNVRNDRTGRILKPGKTKLGYAIVTVGGQSRLVHRLVMSTFMPISKAEASTLTDIDHINADRSDNRLSNLRRCTHSENLHSAHRLALIRHACIALDKNGTVIMQASSISEMAEMLNLSTGCVQGHLVHGGQTRNGITFKRAIKAETRRVAA